MTEHGTEDKLAEEGWSWDNSTKTLILENANFEVNDTSDCIKFSEGDVTIVFKGENTLKAQNDFCQDIMTKSYITR